MPLEEPVLMSDEWWNNYWFNAGVDILSENYDQMEIEAKRAASTAYAAGQASQQERIAELEKLGLEYARAVWPQLSSKGVESCYELHLKFCQAIKARQIGADDE